MSPLRAALRRTLELSSSALTLFLLVPTSLKHLLRLILLRSFWLKPRRGDIFIATYPKSGTTWMQMIVYQLATGGRGEFNHIVQVAPYYEHFLLLDDGERLLDSLPSPRIFKTHLPWGLLRLPREARCIFVTRDAYDSFISGYHHACLEHRVNIPFETFMREAVRGTRWFPAKGSSGSWFQYMKSWWPRRKDARVLHIRYEDLKQDLEGQLRRIAAFCDLPIDESQMGEILRKCGFEYMKQHSARFDPRLSFFDREMNEGAHFIRRGALRTDEGGATLRAELESQLVRLQRKLGIQRSEL